MLDRTRPISPLLLAAAVAAFLPLLGACSAGEGGGESAAAEEAETRGSAAPRVVEISGRDFAFDAPAEISAGWVTFRFTNEGREPHHATLVRLADGVTVEDIVESYGAGKPMVEGVIALGGPNAVMGGIAATATVELAPGRYAIVCFIPSPDGTPHLSKGMIQALTVTGAESEAAPPAADAELEMLDYTFRQSAALEAGRRTIRVTNVAEGRPHEVALARVAEGKTAEDVVAWIQAYEAGEAEGPPPAVFLGGVSALAPGEENYMTVDLEAGDYVWLCPLTEELGQPSHLEHGMYLPFRVS